MNLQIINKLSRLLAVLLLLTLWNAPALLAQDSGGSDPGSPGYIVKGSISGRVTGIDSSLIGSAYVTAWMSDPVVGDWSKGRAMVDSLFAFQIDSLAPGDYYVVAEAPGYLPQYWPGVAAWDSAKTVSVKAGEVTTGIGFLLRPGTIPQGGTISGRITDATGRGLPRISVEALAPMPGPSPDSLKFEPAYSSWGYTDEYGYYYIYGLPAGDYYLRADYYGRWYSQSLWYPQVLSVADARLVNVVEAGETAGIDFTFELAETIGVIHGQVLDAQGAPLAGASIQIMPAPGQEGLYPYVWLYAMTDENGYYEINDVPDGDYIAYCWAQSGWQFAMLYWPAGLQSDQADVINISKETPVWKVSFDMPLIPGSASISGIVRNQEGRPLVNASIQITADGTGTDSDIGRYIYAYAMSDSNGFYEVGKLPAGQYTAYASYWENMSFGQAWFKDADSLGDAEPVVIAEGESRRDIDFNLRVRPIYGSITGLVSNAATGEPIPRAFVEISYQHKYNDLSFRRFAWWPYHAITDESGQFALDWLPEGEYTVSVHANGAFAYYPDAPVIDLAKPVTVVGGMKSETNFSLKLRQDGSSAISGFVSADYQILPMRITPGGKVARQSSILDGYVPEIAIVMAKPSVTVMMWPESEMFYTAVTAQDGSYSLKGLPAGEYHVMAFAPGHMLQYYKQTFDPAAAELVTVGEGESVNKIDFVLQPRWWDYLKEGDNNRGAGLMNANVSGMVTDENNNPVAGATVYLLDTQNQPLSWATTDRNGRYEILGIAPGQYYVQAGKIGFESAYNGNAPSRESTTPVVVANGATEVNLSLNPAGTTEVEIETLPVAVELQGNYPNPFNPETRIHFALPQPMTVTLAVYDLLGRQVRLLHQGLLPEGSHRLLWDGRDASGAAMSSGVYWYRLITPEAVKTGKMVLMK